MLRRRCLWLLAVLLVGCGEDVATTPIPTHISGRVVDAHGGAVGGARVIHEDWRAREDAHRGHVLTASDGSFRIPLEAHIRDSIWGAFASVRVWAEDGSLRSPERVLHLPRMNEAASTALTLIPEQPGVALARILLSDGRPAADADVCIELYDSSLRFDDEYTRYRHHGRTGPNGLAVMDGVLLRDYDSIDMSVRVGDVARQWFCFRDIPRDRHKGRITMEATLDRAKGQITLEATVAPVATVSGVLRDGGEGPPRRYEVAAVRKRDPSYRVDLTWHPVDSDGKFELRDCVLPDSALWVSAVSGDDPGEGPSRRIPILVRQLDVRGWALDLGSIEVPPLGTLKLEFLRDHQPLESGSLSLRRADCRGGSLFLPIKEGKVEVARLPTGGSWIASVWCEGELGAPSRKFTVHGTERVHKLSLGVSVWMLVGIFVLLVGGLTLASWWLGRAA